MSITLKLLNEGFEKKYLQEADKRPKSWILFFDEDGVNRVGSDGSRPSDLLPAKAERLLQSPDYSIPKWAKSYVILTDNQFWTIDYDSLEKFHAKYGKEVPTDESLEEMARIKDKDNPKLQVGTKVKIKPSKSILNDSSIDQDKLNNIIGKVGIVKSYFKDYAGYNHKYKTLINVDIDGTIWTFSPEDLVVIKNESYDDLKEEWIHFQYKSGANPYIAKNQKEAEKIIKKYGKDKVKELRKGFYEIDDSENKNLEEDTTYKAGPFEFSSNLGSKALDTASNIFGKTVDNIEPIVKNIGPIAGAISKVAPLLADDASEKKEVFRNDNGEDYDVIERSKTGKNALLNKGKQWIVASNCPEENEGSWGQGHYFFNEKSARKVWEDGYLDESLKEDKLSKFPRKKTEVGDKQVTKQVLADDFNEKNLSRRGTNEYEANSKRDKHVAMYRKFANLNENDEITEDNINEWALGKTATYANRSPNRIKSEIIGKRYSDYEIE